MSTLDGGRFARFLFQLPTLGLKAFFYRATKQAMSTPRAFVYPHITRNAKSYNFSE